MTPPVELPHQRWVKPYPATPGHWKKQLPTKALALAIKGDIAGMQRLLAETPEALSKRGPHGRTLLWEAARRGRADAVGWLIERGADLLATGCYNGESVVQLTPYCAAVYYRKPGVTALLARAGGDELDVFRAAFIGELQTLQAMLTAQPDLRDAEDPHDEIYYTPVISFAVAGGHPKVVRLLIEHRAQVGPYSAQLIRIALTAGQGELLRYLLDNGVDARAADAGVFQVTDDLHLLEDLLARGASANGVTNGFPPLVFLARGDKGEHPEKLALLLRHGADVNAIGGPGERTALHYAAAAGHGGVATLLLEHGANTKLHDAHGLTARDLAVARGHRELAAGL